MNQCSSASNFKIVTFSNRKYLVLNNFIRTDYVLRISHFDIPVDDPEKMQDFYSKVFDWEFEKSDGPIVLLDDKDRNRRTGNGWGSVRKNARTYRHDKYN